MSKLLISICVSASIIYLSGCEKENPILEIVENVEFQCEDHASDFYFEAFINGEKTCFHAGFEDYDMFLRRYYGVTTGPTLDPSNTEQGSNGSAWATFSFEPLVEWDEINPWLGKGTPGKHYFQIETPKFEPDKELKSMLDDTIHEGELNLTGGEERKDVFNIKYVVIDDEVASLHAPLQSFGGKQDDAYLKVTELQMEEVGSKLNYIITFEFECELYIAGDPGRHYGRLEEGKMRIAFSIDK